MKNEKGKKKKLLSAVFFLSFAIFSFFILPFYLFIIRSRFRLFFTMQGSSPHDNEWTEQVANPKFSSIFLCASSTSRLFSGQPHEQGLALRAFLLSPSQIGFLHVRIGGKFFGASLGDNFPGFEYIATAGEFKGDFRVLLYNEDSNPIDGI